MLPPVLVLRPSRGLLVWLLLIHLLALLAVGGTPGPALARGVVSAVIVASLAWSLRRELRRGGSRLTPLTLMKWRLQTIHGTEDAELVDARIFRRLVVLQYRIGDRRRRFVTVAADAVDEETHRKLRAALTTGGHDR